MQIHTCSWTGAPRNSIGGCAGCAGSHGGICGIAPSSTLGVEGLALVVDLVDSYIEQVAAMAATENRALVGWWLGHEGLVDVFG